MSKDPNLKFHKTNRKLLDTLEVADGKCSPECMVQRSEYYQLIRPLFLRKIRINYCNW
jgi:hypothetical protein